MAILSFSEMPVSFTGQALLDDARMRRKGVFALIFSVFSTTLTGLVLAPLGVCYHTALSIRHKVTALQLEPGEAKMHAEALAFEHLKAAALDWVGVALSVLAVAYHSLVNLENAEVDGRKIRSFWFSSSPVRTEYQGPPLILSAVERLYLSWKLWWGSEKISQDVAPYDRIIQTALSKLERGDIQTLNEPSIISEACQYFFATTHRCQDTRAAMPLFQSEWLVWKEFKGNPVSLFPSGTFWVWLGLAVLMAANAFICLSCIGGLSFIGRLSLFWFLYFFNLLSVSVFLSYQLAVLAKSQFARDKAQAEFEDSQKFPRKPFEALFWLRQAALHGNQEAQRNLGLILMAAATPPRLTAEERLEEDQAENAKRIEWVAEGLEGAALNLQLYNWRCERRMANMEESQVSILREGISWLQAAGKNQDVKAMWILHDIFKLFPGDRIFHVNREDSRSVLTGYGVVPGALDRAILAFREIKGGRGLVEAVQKMHKDLAAVSSAVEEHFIPDLSNIVVEYCLHDSFFFYEDVLPQLSWSVEGNGIPHSQVQLAIIRAVQHAQEIVMQAQPEELQQALLQIVHPEPNAPAQNIALQEALVHLMQQGFLIPANNDPIP